MGRASLACHYCGAMNPPKAYCCLRCLKVLRPKESLPFWRTSFNPGFTGLIVVVILVIASVVGVRWWLSGIDAEVSMRLNSSDYNVSVVANKRHSSPLHLSGQAAPAAPSSENADASQP